MLAFSFIEWWYLHGWGKFAMGLVNKLSGAADFFSIHLLLRSLFAPFKQISAYGSGDECLQGRLRDFSDKLLSRIIGAIIRIFILVAGIVWLLIETVASLALIVLWPILPILPFVGVAMTVMGVTI